MTAQDRRGEIDKLNRLVEGIPVAMLATVDEGGRLRSRPMSIASASGDGPIDREGRLWLLTSAASHKVDEVRVHPEVNLSCADPADHRYVSLSGRASLVRDRERIDAAWESGDSAWLPRGKDDPDAALLCFEVERAEYWDAPTSTMVVLFEYARTMLTGHPFEPARNERIDLGRAPRSG